MKLISSIITVVIITLIVIPNLAHSSLLITPTRVAFEERDRSARVTLLNSSNKEQSYRLELMDQKATVAGPYVQLTELEKEQFPSAQQFLRFSPRQVTLGPGERQTVKVIARRAKDLADGEYRSHLQFTALPPKDDSANSGQMEIKLNLLLSYSIPVILRKGASDVQIDINDIVLISPSEGQQSWQASVRMSRAGLHSPTGRLLAFLVNSDGSHKQVGVLNGLNIFTELDSRQANIILPDFRASRQDALKIVYEGQQEYVNTIFATKQMPLTEVKIERMQ